MTGEGPPERLIEVHGSGFANKGGQLMLETVVRRLGEAARAGGVGLSFGMDPRHDADPRRAAAAGLTLLVPPSLLHRPRGLTLRLRAAEAASRLIPRQIESTYPVRRRHRSAGLVDVSGYAFGDAFGPLKTRNFAARCRLYAGRGRPAILMPQMFGPFDDPAVASAARGLFRHAALCYVRDGESMRHVENLLGGRPGNVRLAPDLTIFEPPTEADRRAAAEEHDAPEGFVALVPNAKMLDKGKATWRKCYVPRMRIAGEAARAADRPVRVVVHETNRGDAELAEAIRAALDLPPSAVLHDARPLRLKAIIGRAGLLIGSRFHAVVAALSSGVPAVVMGWSHKYPALLEDFGVADAIHDADDGEDHLRTKVATLLGDSANAAARRTLIERKEAMRPENERMWREVFQVLSLGGGDNK